MDLKKLQKKKADLEKKIEEARRFERRKESVLAAVQRFAPSLVDADAATMERVLRGVEIDLRAETGRSTEDVRLPAVSPLEEL